jgi:hypothetical protein
MKGDHPSADRDRRMHREDHRAGTMDETKADLVG